MPEEDLVFNVERTLIQRNETNMMLFSVVVSPNILQQASTVASANTQSTNGVRKQLKRSKILFNRRTAGFYRLSSIYGRKSYLLRCDAVQKISLEYVRLPPIQDRRQPHVKEMDGQPGRSYRTNMHAEPCTVSL